MAKRVDLRRFRAEPLYFLHLHKTGGQSMIPVLDRCFRRTGLERFVRRTRICPAMDFSGLAALPDERLDSYSLYRGHFGFHLPAFLSRTPVVITMLRDPVARVISHYHHLRRAPDRPLHGLVAGGMTLEEFCRHEVTRRASSNLQARNLGGKTPERRLTSADARCDPVEGPDGFGAGEDEATLRERAIRRLDECAAVGLTEQFDRSVALFADVLGLPLRSETKRRNVGGHGQRPDELDDRTRAAIEDANRLDLELFALARARFERDAS
ncbi:hypothetical protein [Alienimonas sp. DA493]|uniref:hypothetical protein n=1 Tax=Alienimonas sp. DA493 TaxID=3373605 RepID=UPI003754B96E